MTNNHNNTSEFDKVIFACHFNQILELLDDLNHNEKIILAIIINLMAILHTDDSIMPKRQLTWSSWNYLSSQTIDKRKVVSLSYWMNNLQPLNTTYYFVTINPDQKPQQSKIY